MGAGLWRWWLAPIAATAAAVTIWMVVPQRPMQPPASEVARDVSEPAAKAQPQSPPVEFAEQPPRQRRHRRRRETPRGATFPPRRTKRRPSLPIPPRTPGSWIQRHWTYRRVRLARGQSGELQRATNARRARRSPRCARPPSLRRHRPRRPASARSTQLRRKAALCKSFRRIRTAGGGRPLQESSGRKTAVRIWIPVRLAGKRRSPRRCFAWPSRGLAGRPQRPCAAHHRWCEFHTVALP